MNWYHKPTGVQTRWISFENSAAAKGRGGMSNGGAKGHACEALAAGETKTLCDLRGSGVIRRLWMTLSDRSPKVLRSLRLEMTWDDATGAAVSCPLGDFFGIAHGQLSPHCNAMFSSPEGRSLNCTIPMPFRSRAKVTLTNESPVDVRLFFYEIDAEHSPVGVDDLYFHATWRRERPTELGRDFDILPRVAGRGRFLGCNIGVIANPLYGDGWWGEGEVKGWIDGDTDWPTLVGTGAEDYIGTGWGMNVYFHPHQGCSVADKANRRWAFYRYHIPDPVYFDRDCRIAIQSMGGMPKKDLLPAIERGARVKLATAAGTKMVDHPQLQLSDPQFGPDAWCNHYREDDYCATAYFYLDQPANHLPPLAEMAERVAGVSDAVDTRRADV